MSPSKVIGDRIPRIDVDDLRSTHMTDLLQRGLRRLDAAISPVFLSLSRHYLAVAGRSPR